MAATRARDLLVVPALGDDPWDGGWFGPLNSALYPPPAARRSATRAPKCPAFKSKDTVLERTNNEPAGSATVCPGQHALGGADGYAVTWWDPGALILGAKPPFGVRREELIVKDVARHVVADGRSRYDRWHLARDDARAAGATASTVARTVREWTASFDDPGREARGDEAERVQLVPARSLSSHFSPAKTRSPNVQAGRHSASSSMQSWRTRHLTRRETCWRTSRPSTRGCSD